MDGSKVVSFQEKPQLHDGWINGGYFIMEPDFFELIEGDLTLLEREPLEQATKAGELMAYHHDGFWHCMDTSVIMNYLSHSGLKEHHGPFSLIMRAFLLLVASVFIGGRLAVYLSLTVIKSCLGLVIKVIHRLGYHKRSSTN